MADSNDRMRASRGYRAESPPSGTGTRPRVGLVGPMLGSNPGWVVSQGEILAELLRADGYEVEVTSRIRNRPVRLIDTIVALLRWRKRVDVVVVMVFSGAAFAVAEISASLATQLGKPVVLVLRGGALPEFVSRHRRRVGRLLAHAERVVAPSSYLAEQLGSDVRIDVIPNVISLEKYPFRLRERISPRLLWMRTFHPVYNPEMAVDVIAELRRTHPNASLTMAGQDKGSRAATESYARRRGAADAVNFVGFLDLEGKRREFAAHDVFLNTSRVDNMPVSVVEAAAFGVPIVATAVGGIPYLLEHQRTALFVGDDDPVEMADAIRRLLDEPQLVSMLSLGGRRLAEKSAWTRVAPLWEQTFERVLR